MGYAKRVHAFAAILMTSMGLVAYVNTPAPRVDAAAANPTMGSEPQATFTDPFAYCAALGTIDLPDSRYTGPQVPETVARGLKKAFGAPADAALDFFLNNTVWRCMDGMVYACTVGANLPCQEQADTSRKPTQEMTDFCRNNRQADVIPMVVTGRTTVYEWKCAHGVPEIVRQFTRPDARGFLSNIWYAISPSS